jgi:hypothetical protein
MIGATAMLRCNMGFVITETIRRPELFAVHNRNFIIASKLSCLGKKAAISVR